MHSLKRQWTQLTRKYCGDSHLIDEIFQDIEKRYQESHRRYHTLEHLQSMFADLAEPIAILSNAQKHGILFATWFHDIVYVPGDKNNEELSAEYAVKTLLQLRVPENISDFVKQAILSTQQHEAENSTYCTDLFLDADMAILGKPTREYLDYANAIYYEFKHIPRIAFKLGRKKFIKATLKRQRIFETEYFYQRYENQARTNLLQELKSEQPVDAGTKHQYFTSS